MAQEATEQKPSSELTFDGGFIGDACSDSNACSEAFSCFRAFDDETGAFPDGYCSSPCPKHTCFDHPDYPWSRCVLFEPSSTPVCMIECESTGDCREGYTCQNLPRSNGNGSRTVCVPETAAAQQALADLAETEEAEAKAARGRNEQDNASSQVELIDFEETAGDASSEATVRNNDGGNVGWWLPVTLGFVAIVVLLAGYIYWRRKENDESDNSDSANKRRRRRRSLRPDGGTRSKTGATRPLLTRSGSGSRAAAVPMKSSDEPAPGERSTSETTPHTDPSPEPTPDSGDSVDSGHPSPKWTPIPDEELEPTTATDTHEQPEAAGDDSSSEANDELQNVRPLHERPANRLVPSLRGNQTADDKPPAYSDNPLSESAWKPKRISLPIRDGFAPPEFSAEEAITSTDDIAPPVAFDVCLHLIDRLLQDAEEFRARRGYEDVALIESDPTRFTFELADGSEVRVRNVEPSLTKETLAADKLRQHDFDPEITAREAHVLSLVGLATYLLGTPEPESRLRSFAALARDGSNLQPDTLRFIRILSEGGPSPGSEPDEASRGANLHELYVRTRQTAQELRRRIDAIRQSEEEETERELAECPACSASIESGNLACPHCGVALHPRPFFCPDCGTKNVLRADDESQTCRNPSCASELDQYVPTVELENRRLSVIFSLLSRFDDFKRLAPRGGGQRYAAVRDGTSVEVIQYPADLAIPLMESDRQERAIDERICLPTELREESGLRFVVYEGLPEDDDPVQSLGPMRLAERLFELLVAAHASGLSTSTLTRDDMQLARDGSLIVRYGHKLTDIGRRVSVDQLSSFAAPEQRMGEPLGTAGDLWYAAALWFHIVRGHDVDEGALTSAPPDDLLLEPHVWKTLTQCLASEPAGRPESAADVLASIRNEKKLTDLI